MKIKITDAARRLRIHPAHLLLHIAELDPGLSFSDVWPEIDEAWVQTVAASGGHRQAPREIPHQPTKSVAATPGLSRNAIHVLDKLSRQGKWGNVSVTFDALMNLTHLSKRDLEDAIGELRKQAFLDRDGTGRGTISLDPQRGEDIKRLSQQAERR
jgi:hypothetical protein